MIEKKNKRHGGAALLVVLFIVMAITILAFNFMTRSDIELACGQNMTLRTAMDYLAESGLQHARGLILNPQDVSTEYWTGAAAQQLVADSSDYYDVTVTRIGNCNYKISSEAYRQKGAEKIGRSNLTAELRLDPCIALWTGSSWNSEGRVTVNGDVYCNGDLGNSAYGYATINGDAFARGDITIPVRGSKNAYASAPITLPGLDTSQFSSSYYIGTNSYSVQTVTGDLAPPGYYPSESNPAGIYYYNGDANLPGDVTINGMLVVKGNLKVKGTNNVITAVKNFPALLVGGTLTMENAATLSVEGLCQVKNDVTVKSMAKNVHIIVNGALLILNGDIDGLVLSTGSTANITAYPDKAAIQVWLSPGVPTRWSPAGGAFFRSITRQ